MTRSIFTFLILLVAFTEATAQDGEKFLSRQLPDSWSSNESITTTPPDNNLWWQTFGDAQLDSLITVATERNYSVLGAIENMKRAKAVWRQAQGNLLPQMSLTAGWQRAKSSGNTALTEFRETYDGYFSGGISMSWQVDVFGGIYMRSKAQKRLFQASEEEYRAVMVTLCANVTESVVLRSSRLVE